MVNRRYGNKMKGSSEKKRSSGFTYKPPSAKKLKERSERQGGSFERIFKSGVDMLELRTGVNNVRILPPTWDDHDHFGYTVYMHMRIGPDRSDFLCPRKMKNKPCAACDAAAEAKRNGDDEEAQQFSVRERVLYYVLDREEDDNVPRIWNASFSQDKEIVGYCLDRRTGEAIQIDNPDDGFDLTFKRTGKGLKTKYTNWQFERDSSPISDDSDVQEEVLQFITDNPIPSLLVFAKPEKIAAAVSGGAEETDPDDDDEPKKKRRPRDEDDNDDDDAPPKKKRRPDPDDDADDDDEPPPRKKRRPDPDDDDEDDDAPPRKKRPARDEDDEDDDEPPKKKKRRPDPDDEDDDDAPPRKRRPRDEDDDDDEPPPRKRTRVRD